MNEPLRVDERGEASRPLTASEQAFIRGEVRATRHRDRRPRRPAWPVRMLMLARWWSQWSTCPRLSAGCVITRGEFIPIASGYNGAPRGVEHCADVGCHLEGGHCTAVHAEQNALMHAAQLGISVSEADVFVTHRPCIRCAYLLGQAGVGGVFWSGEYDSDGSRDVVTEYFYAQEISYRRVILPEPRRGELSLWR